MKVLRVRALTRLIAGLALAQLAVAGGAFAANAGASTSGGTEAASEFRQVGSLRFKACTIGAAAPTVAAWCAEFKVPENRAQPKGRNIGLRVAMVPSASASPAADWVTYLDGGPGAAATETWPALQGAFGPALRERNLLLVDQRGTGGSHALRCESVEDSGTDSLSSEDLPQLKREFARCAAKLGRAADLRQYTTSAAVADLEAVRTALGSPALDLVGTSYGTRVAQQYAARYPAGTRTVVLDGVVPNRLALPEEHALNLDVALKAHAALCLTNGACRAKFGDSYVALHRLLAALRRKPVKTTLIDGTTGKDSPQRVTAELVASAVRLYSYAPLTAALLPAAIDAATRGNYAPLLGQSLSLAGSLQERLNQGMAMSVNCAEDADLIRRDPAEDKTVLGHSLVDALRAVCAVWPKGQRPADFHAPFRSDKPVLVLSGEHDPVTPARYGEEVVQTLANGRALVAHGQGHSVIGVGCVPRLLADFIDRADARGLDVACLEDLGDTPALLDLNGSAP